MPVLPWTHDNTLEWTECTDPQMSTRSIRSTSIITQLLFEYGRIITADDAGVILIFSHNGELKFHLKGHAAGVWCLSATRTRLVSGSEDKTIRVWNLFTGTCRHVFRGHTDVVRCLQIVKPEHPLDSRDSVPGQPPRFQPIRPLIVSGSRDGSVRVWMLPRMNESEYGLSHKNDPVPDPDPDANPYHLYHLTGHAGPVRCIAANRKTVLSGGDDCTVRAHNIKENTLLGVLRGHTAKITNTAIDPRLRIWYSVSLDGELRLWGSKDGSLLAVCSQHMAGITLMFITPWRIVTAGQDALAITWNAAVGTRLHVMQSGDGNYMVGLCGDDHKVLTCTEASAKMWHPQDGRLQCALTYKDSRGRNMLSIIDFRPPETINESLYPLPGSQDSGDQVDV